MDGLMTYTLARFGLPSTLQSDLSFAVVGKEFQRKGATELKKRLPFQVRQVSGEE